MGKQFQQTLHPRRYMVFISTWKMLNIIIGYCRSKPPRVTVLHRLKHWNSNNKNLQRKKQNLGNTKCWWGRWATETLWCCWWDCKMVQPLQKVVWPFLIKLNIPLPYNPAIPLVGIYPKEVKTYVHTRTCTWMFIGTAFMVHDSLPFSDVQAPLF